MSRFFALALMSVGLNVYADCQDEWLEHLSSKSYLSVSYSEGCYHGKLILNYSKLSKKGPQWPDPSSHLESIPFDRECQTKKKDKNGETIEFSCRKNGVSPLVGATYRFKQVKTTILCDGINEPDVEHSFICIRGCGASTPRKLYVPHGEGCA